MNEHSQRPTVSPHALREYALIADGERGAVIGPHGEFAWMCFPFWDSDALFATLIGGRGVYSIRPTGRYVWGGYYEEGTLIWRSRWITDDGAAIECREALALPAHPDCCTVLRRVVVLDGEARVGVALQPMAGFGSERVRQLKLHDDGCWRGTTGATRFCWAGAAQARAVADGHGGRLLELELELRAGDEHDFVLELSCDCAPAGPAEARRAWAATEDAWRRRVPDLGAVVGRRDARHSVAVLSGLTSRGGGMVAAATTALPERAQAGRNYDYRYVWIRDQCYAGRAAARAGAFDLLDAAVSFVTERLLADGPQLKPAYTTRGDAVPGEAKLALPGYPGAAAVKGNDANDQFQLDAFGETLLLLAVAAGTDRIDADGWVAAETAVKAIEERAAQPDSGIWEIEPRLWTHSRLICAAGLRALARCTTKFDVARWLSLADSLVGEMSAGAVSPDGYWQRAPDDGRLDASLLLAAVRGAVPADDPRSLATLEAYVDRLTVDHYAYRYSVDGLPLGQAEGAFLLCGFFVALAYLQQGDVVEAARWFERNRAASGPPGLLCEEFDIQQRQLRGNLPQAFVHALLLETALELTAVGDAKP
jgi:alpha,alpha-trehalase